MSITVKLVDGTQRSVDVPDLSITVGALKELMTPVLDIPANEQRIVFRGKVLKDNEVLSAVGLEHGNAVHVVRSKKPAAPPATTTTTTTATAPAVTPPAPTATPPAPGANPYAALMSGMFGAPGGMPASTSANPAAPVGAMPGMADMAAGIDPSLIIQMMQNPAMAQLVANAASDESLLERNYAFANTPPEMRQYVSTIMRNPAMLQAMASMLAQNSQAMAQAGGANAAGGTPVGFPAASAPGGLPPPAASAAFNPALFGMMPPAPQGNPREIYREQLAQLREMGFPNEDANIAALQEAHGNIHFAIERLFSA